MMFPLVSRPFAALMCVLFLIALSCGQRAAPDPVEEPADPDAPVPEVLDEKGLDPVVGAARTAEYFPLLQGKRIALTVNHTSFIGGTHLADSLVAAGMDVRRIFAPEHGFRGQADAGATVKDGKDAKTGIPIVSLYGKNKKPSPEQLEGLDIVVFDIQDVGARFYTYISTMHYVMEACAEKGIPVLVLDRPNPNGHYVDGPIREDKYKSFVGMHPIPVVHGMTVVELARMINGENWLKGGVQCDLKWVECLHYDHNTFYELPIKPSPNLPNMRSIYLYPSLCFFEGTDANVGRGTDTQFQVVGHPDYPDKSFSYTPVSKPGAKHPKHKGKTCYGVDLSGESIEELRKQGRLDLNILKDYYDNFSNKNAFFLKNNFINKLAGTATLKDGIVAGKSADEIAAGWQAGIDDFKSKRKRYLLYADFE